MARICTYECTFCADCVDNKCRMSAQTAVVVSRRGQFDRRRSGDPGFRLPSDRLQISECIFLMAFSDIAAHTMRIKESCARKPLMRALSALEITD